MSGDIWKEARVGNGDEGVVKKDFGTISENGFSSSYQNNPGQDQERSESMVPVINTVPSVSGPHVQTNNTGPMHLPGNYQEMLDQHNEFKKIRKMCKEKASFAKEDQEAAYKNALYGHLAGRVIFPLPVRTNPSAVFPLSVFPQRAQQWIQDFAKSFSVDPCVAGTLLLGVLSISANGKFFIERHAEHVELMTLYNLIMMNSGKLKSPMLETALQPLKKLEKRLQDTFFEEEDKQKTAREIYEKRVNLLKNQAAKNGGVAEAVEEIAKIKSQMPPQKSVPRLLTFRFTPEGLEKEAAQQDGKMAIVGAELGSFKNIPASKDDFVLQAWAGEPFVSSKVKDPIRIDNPCLSILLATQGATSVNLLGSEALQEDGLVARFICLVPPDVPRMSFENPLTKAMNVGNTQWLEHVVRDIYEAPMPSEGHLRLQIQEGSLQNWDIFSHQALQQAENQFHPSVLQSWYRKLAGTALRFAGFLHLLKCIEGKRAFSEPVDQESVDGGLHLGCFYEQHAQVAMDINANDNLKRAREALLILKECGDFEISLRDIYREKKWTKEQALSAVNLLEVSGMVACYKSGNSTRCLIHPGLKTSLFAY